VSEFKSFGKIGRYSREVVVTEKIDGTNAQLTVSEDGARIESIGSRNRFVTTLDEHFGFPRWVREHETELLQLGPGTHYGEWWGLGIQRNYGLTEKRFSLFNVERWGESRPACCHVVPVLWRGLLDNFNAQGEIDLLRRTGSVAAPGFMKPEGIVIFHRAAMAFFKKTIEKDDEPKNLRRRS
jgi:hypothetical protein